MSNSKLSILANGKPMTLGSDFSISVELRNPLFNDDEMFSYPVDLPFEGNRHFLKNLDDPSAAIRPLDLEHTNMQIVADGITLASGTAVVQDGERADDSLSLNVDAATRSFSDLIGDLKCNEVPIPSRYRDRLLIGEKIDEVNVKVKYSTTVEIKFAGKKGNKVYGSVGDDRDESITFSPQALGFSYPAACKEDGAWGHKAVEKETRYYPNSKSVVIPEVTESYINVSEAYPAKPYCNARICYAHYDITDDGNTSDKIVQYAQETAPDKMYEDMGPLWVLDADRPQSGICFYLLFFLDCLFEHLGVQFDKDALTEVYDFNRLCFFTTKCAYDVEPLYAKTYYDETDKEVITGLKKKGDVKLGYFTKRANNESEVKDLFNDVNAWLDSRGCGGNLKLENPKNKSVQQVRFRSVQYKIVEKEQKNFMGGTTKKTEVVKVLGDWEQRVVGEDDVVSITCRSTITGADMSASIFRMYANGENFPNETVSDVIESLEQQFGIKFNYDYEQKKVTAYLIRDVFRKQNPQPRRFLGQVLSFTPITEKITGVKVGYSAESDAREQRDNVKNKVKDYNTDYDYIDYNKDKTSTAFTYREILPKISNTLDTLFIDKQTGNKYRVKIDSQYTDVSNMEPRLFEVGAFKGVEFGDCSDENEEFIHEIKSSFMPVPMVDANYRKARSANFDSTCVSDNPKQPTETGKVYEGKEFQGINSNYAENIMVASIEDKMEHEFIEQNIKTSISSPVADFYVTEVLSLRESYSPSSTDDGNSPLQSHDWGISVAIMRGGGAGATHEVYDPDYDGFGNSKWRTTAGKYALTTDSIDCYGNVYGVANADSFSLKPRAWVQPEWADAPLIISDPFVKNRGWVDTFLVDYIYFLLNRKMFYVKVLASVAQVADIKNHWKEWWNIDGRKCLINKVNTSISVQDGIGEVELEVYAL